MYILDGGASLHTSLEIGEYLWWNMQTVLQVCDQSLWVANCNFWWMSGCSNHKGCGPQNTRVGATVHFTGAQRHENSSHNKNKQQFIVLLRKHLECHNCVTDQAVADADLLIMETTITATANTQKSVILVGYDTDLLVLLRHHTTLGTQNVYLRPEPKLGSKHPPRCWNIADLKDKDVCNNILFVHAILEFWDVTQRLMYMV